MIPLYALHGMFCHPSDWNFLPEPVYKVDLFAAQPLACSLWDWATQFNGIYRDKGILLGYSLGSRLALHALLQNPRKWQGAVLVSAHPGLKTDAERMQRREEELLWVKDIHKLPWHDLVQKWNQQSVFSGTPSPFERREEDFCRATLSFAMDKWALSHQEDLRPRLAELKCPILFVTGARDKKYTSLAQEMLALNPQFQHQIIPQSGHRAPWEQPAPFLKILNTFTEACHATATQ